VAVAFVSIARRSHRTTSREELYVVVRAAARSDLDGKEHVLTAPAFVAITDPVFPRSAVAASADAILITVGRSPEGIRVDLGRATHARRSSPHDAIALAGARRMFDYSLCRAWRQASAAPCI
jgi:hypothetical protein